MNEGTPRGLYVYAVADRPTTVSVSGIFRRPVRAIDLPGIPGLHPIIEAAARAPRQSMRRLREQDRVLRALALKEGASIIPARFGSFLPGVYELQIAVRDRAADLRRTLRLVRGCMQMTTRVFFSPADPPPDGKDRRPRTREDRVRTDGEDSLDGPALSGTAHLMNLADAERARRNHPVVASVRRRVAPFVKAERAEWHDTGAMTAVSLFHLVPRTRLEPYVDALARARRDDGARILVTGPFLPFAFAQSVW